jgi:UDP-glucose 4-epimerase
MAASSLVGESMENPGKYYRNNLLTGVELLDAMHACDVNALVFSSTAAVYGNPAKQPIEEGDPLDPTNTYGETKLAFERALRWYGRVHGLRHTSLRYFNAAGASGRFGEQHDPETHLIPLVLRVAAGQAAEVAVFGNDYPTPDGTCVRDYVHVTDLARAHILALRGLTTSPVPGSDVFNLGCGGDGYSVRAVVQTAEAVTGRRIPMRITGRRPGDPPVLIASAKRIAAELGWKPKNNDLTTIIRSAWQWMQETGRT